MGTRLLLGALSALLCSATAGEARGARSCAETRRALASRGFSLASVPPTLSSDFFQELLAGAERSLQAVLVSSYGRLYVQHACLFVELHHHLKGPQPSLDEALSGFWSQLLEQMLPLLNPQYSFPEGYLECVEFQVESLHAFGDSPHQLRVQDQGDREARPAEQSERKKAPPLYVLL